LLKIYVDADACQVVRIVEIDEDLDCIFYDIDCGCAMRKKRPNGKLACIRLEVVCLITTSTLKECLLKAVNLGDDTDTIAAIAGGLAGLYYGYEQIPEEWLAVIQRRGWIEDMCRNMSRKAEEGL
jgi:hypothetical protein